MKFIPLTQQHISLAKPFFSLLSSRTCDFTTGGMFMWHDFYHMEYAVQNGAFYSRLRTDNGTCFYNLPLSTDIPAALLHLVQQTEKEPGPLRFCTIPEEYLPVFQARFPHARLTEQPEYFDYLYLASDIRELKGRSYSSQRNHIHQFQRSVVSWHFEPLDSRNLSKTQAFFSDVWLPQSALSATACEENRMTREVLENYEQYGMIGGLLWADGRVAGFSLGERIKDTLYIHIEKANKEQKGAYAMLAWQFLHLYASEDVVFVNREEDMGDPGLRKAKEAYHPCRLLKKYVVEVP